MTCDRKDQIFWFAGQRDAMGYVAEDAGARGEEWRRGPGPEPTPSCCGRLEAPEQVLVSMCWLVGLAGESGRARCALRLGPERHSHRVDHCGNANHILHGLLTGALGGYLALMRIDALSAAIHGRHG